MKIMSFNVLLDLILDPKSHHCRQADSAWHFSKNTRSALCCTKPKRRPHKRAFITYSAQTLKLKNYLVKIQWLFTILSVSPGVFPEKRSPNIFSCSNYKQRPEVCIETRRPWSRSFEVLKTEFQHFYRTK